MYGLDKQQVEIVHKYNNHFYKTMKGSLKLKREQILIISDYGTVESKIAPMLGYGYYHAAQLKSFPVTILFQEVKKGFMRVDDHVLQAVKHLAPGNIILVAVSNKLGRIGEEKSYRGFCKESNHRFLSATGLGDVKTANFNLFMQAIHINYARLKKKGMIVKKMWDKAKKIRVMTEAGTDVTFDVEGMEAIANVGEYHKPGMGGNMPAGEVYIPPKGFNGVTGKVVLDGSMKTEHGAVLLDESVVLTIEEGKVVKINGASGHLLEKALEKFEARAKYPERVRFVGELGVGINPGAVLLGSTIIDEKVLGTGHIAIGSNAWFGGAIKTIFHGDQIFKNPIFYVDGVRMVI